MKLDSVQLSAVDRAINSRFAMINGGAGTGKTTIIKTIADNIGRNVRLCAFAGKAAARLKEATGHKATTIHRMLGYNGDSFTVPDLHGKTVVVDEASMVPSDLLSEIMIRNPSSLILVGDQAQLTPVGRGQPFHDLLHSYPGKVTTLTTCYRATEAVFRAATMIRAGELPPAQLTSEREGWRMQETGNPELTHAEILEYVKAGHIDFDQDIILVARNGDDADTACSVKGLNRSIMEAINPRTSDEKLQEGDRVINEKNYADKDVWNGTTGKIEYMDSDNCPIVRLDTPITDELTGEEKYHVTFDKEMRKTLSLAYALTVHKSQGSQYRNVLFTALQRDSRMLLDRSLIYTAVTRTRSACLVMGQRSAFAEGIRTIKEKETVLQELAKA